MMNKEVSAVLLMFGGDDVPINLDGVHTIEFSKISKSGISHDRIRISVNKDGYLNINGSRGIAIIPNASNDINIKWDR